MKKSSKTNLPLSKREERKIRILEVTLNLMVKYGYKGTTTRMIAEAAGVNEVTIFRYFKTKKAILDGLLKEAKSLSRSRLFHDFENSEFSNIEELMNKYSMMAFESFLLNRDLFLLFIKEIGNDESEFYQLHLQAVSNITNLFNKKINDLNKKEKINKTDLKNASYIYHAATLGAFYWYAINGKQISKSDMKSYIKSITKILLYGIKN
jgi:AcrR family transcriptional regulator